MEIDGIKNKPSNKGHQTWRGGSECKRATSDRLTIRLGKYMPRALLKELALITFDLNMTARDKVARHRHQM